MLVEKMSVSKKRVENLLSLIFDIQDCRVQLDDEASVPLSSLGVNISEYLHESFGDDIFIDWDIDEEIIDTLFSVKEICGTRFTLVNTNGLIGVSKETLITYIHNFTNLHKLLVGSKEKLNQKVVEEKQAVAVSSGEIIPADKPESINKHGMPDEVMEQYMLSELMNQLQGNPMATMALMQKQMEGKLNHQNLMRIVTACGGMGGGRFGNNNPMTNMMVMRAINEI